MDLQRLARLLGLPDLDADLERIEGALRALITSTASPIDDACLRVTLSGGKRLRPILTLAAAAPGGRGFDEPVVSGAVSVELVHVGSLVHDDIMDLAEERRGVATINTREGEAIALLAGDYLLGLAGRAAASVSREVAAVLADTIVALSEGQARETVDVGNVDRSREHALRSIEGKTAALMSASCTIGGLCGGLPAPSVEALGTFGRAFGMAFQLVDDVLDVMSTEELMGKPVGNDIRQGVFTLPVLLSLDSSDGPELRRLLGLAGAGMIGDDELAVALELVRAGGGVKATLDLAQRYNQRARDALAGLDGHPSIEGLAELPTFYCDAILGEKVPG